MARSALFYVVLAVVALSFAPQVLAFGAGEFHLSRRLYKMFGRSN